MGVRGLSKFIDEQHPEFYKTCKLHDCRVVIDGSNLIHYLYTYSRADFMFGGNYDEYSEAIKQYFSSFTECNVSPVVVLDGGFNTSDRMFEKLLERHDNRLEKVKTLVDEWEAKESILPLNSFDIFKEVLHEIGIKLIQCDYEGDNQMAALANDFQCPVLSDDSDFYIYDLQHGFIRLSYIDTQVQSGKSKKGNPFKYLHCRIYYNSSLINIFPLKDKTILSLYAVILGNDYSTYEDFKNLFYQIGVIRKERFTGLLAWLSKYDSNQAKRQVLYLTAEEKRGDIENLIESSIDDYRIKPTNLRNILLEGQLLPHHEVVRETRMYTLCGTKLPASFVVAFHNGMSSSLLNIITLHLKFLPPHVEKLSNVSCHACSRYVRQVTYGILLQHSVGSPKKHAKECFRKIDEYDRINDKIQRVSVEFLTKLRNGRDVPALEEIYSMKKSHLRNFIEDLLGLQKSFFTDLPNALQLLLGCINYWLQNCVHKPSNEFVYALLLCIIYYQFKGICIRRNTSKLDIKPVFFQNISLHEAQISFQNLSPYLQKPFLSRRHPFRLQTVYSYNQLQACVLDVTQLNVLMNLPFETPRLSEVFSGTLLYNLTQAIYSSRNPDGILKQLLGPQSKAVDLFYFLRSKVLWNIPMDYFETSPPWREPRH